MASFLQIVIASVGFGIGAEALRRYSLFKSVRRLRAYDERNSGFWTDARLYQAEYAFASMALGIPFCGILLAIWTNRNFGAFYAALLLYPAAIYLIVRGLNRVEPQ